MKSLVLLSSFHLADALMTPEVLSRFFSEPSSSSPWIGEDDGQIRPSSFPALLLFNLKKVLVFETVPVRGMPFRAEDEDVSMTPEWRGHPLHLYRQDKDEPMDGKWPVLCDQSRDERDSATRSCGCRHLASASCAA